MKIRCSASAVVRLWEDLPEISTLGELPLPEEDMVVVSEGREISAQNVPLCFEWQVWEHVTLNLTSLPAGSERREMRRSAGPLDVRKLVLNF